MTDHFADRKSTDSEKVAVLVHTSAQDFNWESGYFYIQRDFMTDLLHWHDLDKFARAIESRGRDLGKRLKFEVEEEPNHPVLGKTILVTWRAMTLEEKIRDDLTSEFANTDSEYVSPQERIERVLPKIMKELNG